MMFSVQFLATAIIPAMAMKPQVIKSGTYLPNQYKYTTKDPLSVFTYEIPIAKVKSKGGKFLEELRAVHK